MTEPNPKPPKSQKYCPKGHPIRKKFGDYTCSQERCGEDMAAAYGPQDLNLDILAATPPADVAFQARKQLANMPDGLKGDAALKWSQEKMIDLLPEAVANIAHDLRYGSDKQREAATDRVLRANGMDKKDANAGMGGQGLIVLNLGNGGGESIPWLQRMQAPKLATPVASEEAEEGDS